VKALQAGEFIVVTDHADRENEGDLIGLASKITAKKMAFMIKYTSGLVCVPMDKQRCEALSLPQMVQREANDESHATAFTVSTDINTYGAKRLFNSDVTTGISAGDRATTIRALGDKRTAASDLSRPGHIFPLQAQSSVFLRAGHTEASVTFARLSGANPPVAVICELTNDNEEGTMMRGDLLKAFCEDKGLVLCSISDLKLYPEVINHYNNNNNSNLDGAITNGH